MSDAGGLGIIVTLLVIGLVAGSVLRRIGLSPIVGYLIAGAFVGEHGFDLIQESKTTHLLAEAGVIFLLFDIGLHLSLRDLWASRRDLFLFGPAQVMSCGAVIAGAFYLFDLPSNIAIVAAFALALSSTALVVQSLVERNMQSTPLGRKAIAILIFQDICAVVILVCVQIIGAEQDGSIAAELGVALVKAIIAIGLVMLVGRLALKPVFRWIVARRQEEVFTTAALVVVLGTAMFTGLAGLSLPLGAFLAGLILSESEYCYLVKAEIKPFRTLLLGFFFMTVGMSLDVTVLVSAPVLVLSIVVLLTVFKAGLIYIIGRLTGLAVTSAARLALLLAQGSEFAFVVFALALSNGLMDAAVAAPLVAAVTFSMLITPGLAMLGDAVAAGAGGQAYARQLDDEKERKIMILGGAPAGLALGRALSAVERRYVIVLNDPSVFSDAQASGFPVAFGDPGDPGLLTAADAGSSDAFVVALEDPNAIQQLKEQLAHQFPHVRSFVAETSTNVDGQAQPFVCTSHDLLCDLGVSAEDADKALARERREHQTTSELTMIPARAG